MSSQIKSNMLWNAAGSLIYLVSQWLVTVLVTRFYGYADAGILSLAMSITATFQTIALFGIRNYQVSDIENKYSDGCYMTLRGMTSLAAFVLCAAFSALNDYSAGQLLAIIWFMLFRLAEDYSDAIYGIVQKNGRLDIAGKGFAIKGALTLAVFLAAYFLGESLNTALLTMAAASWASTLLFDLPAARRVHRFGLLDDLRKSVLLCRETLPLCVYLFFSSAVSVIPKYILEKMTDEATLGAYSSIFAPAVILCAASGYIYTPFIGTFAEAFSQRRSGEFLRAAVRISLAITGLSLLALAASLVLGDTALELVFGESILQYSKMLPGTIAATFAMSLASFVYMLEVVVRDFRNLIIGCVIGCAAAAGSSAVLIGAVGADGTSAGIIVGELLSIIYMTVTLIRRLRKTALSQGHDE